jgi:hypothetical protein
MMANRSETASFKPVNFGKHGSNRISAMRPRGWHRSGGGLGAGVLPQALPLAWRQLQDQPRRMRRDALDHIAQVNERIDL